MFASKGGLRPLFAVFFALTLAAGVFLFVRARQPQLPQSGEPAEYAAAYQGLCDTRTAARTDLARARDVFYVRSHTTLHVLAAELTPKDTALAGRLLEAKNRVEGDLGGTSTGRATTSMDSLLDVSREALEFLGVPVQPCPS